MFKKIIIGFLVGFVSSLFGSGGGLLLIPFYLYFFHFSEKEARANTIFCIFPIVILSTFFYGINNYINIKISLLCIVGSILGSFIGSKLLNTINGKYLKLIFIIFLIFSGCRIIF